ncbi:hypothetical protein DL771_007829 [Monosporascus sp. 5C6A]|nr:hypothetical protein DL771_007829 [Monosporascus sp. 5C6A]
MVNPGDGAGVQFEHPQAALSNDTSKDNNMESGPEGASPLKPNDLYCNCYHGDNKKPAIKTSSDSSKLTVVDGIFGLQRQAEEAAKDDDSDSGSEEEDIFFERSFFSDVLYFVRRARRAHDNQRRHHAIRKAEKKAAKLADKNNLVNKVEQESARQISTAAFLKGEPATVTWVDWDLFVVPKGELENSLMTPIDAVVGEPEPQLILQITSRVTNNPNSAARGKFGGTRAPDRGVSAEGQGQAPLPERVKIHSGALHNIFSKLDSNRAWKLAPDVTMVFLRPFREFIHYETKLRGFLDELEDRFKDWDGTDKPPAKDGDDAATGDGAGGGGDRKTDSSGKDGSKEERAENDGKTKRPEGPKAEWEAKDEDESERTSTSVTALLHLRCLMKFIQEEIKPKLEYIESDRCRRILFHDLWHLFKPGNEVVDQTEKQAYRIIRVQIPRHKVEDPWLRWYGKPSSDEDERKEDEMPVTVHCAYIDFDGKQFGPVSVKFSIPPFGGLKDVKSLPIYPLRFAKDAQLRDTLITRGKMLLDIAKFKPMYYMGFTLDTRDEIDSQVVVDFSEALADEKRKQWAPTIESLRTAPDDRDEDPCRAACCLQQAVREDEYIDSSLTEDFVKSLIPDASFRAPSLILSPRPLEETMPGTEDEPTDEEFLVMTYRVFGFVLRSRKWAQLDLTFLKYENTDARSLALNAFERLELPDGHRQMVKSLVTQHFRDRQSAFAKGDQTDLVKGKGKGLILLLHGAPGVGKITTAGDLGTTARTVEAELEKNFALASRWGCILLLDEADVFLSSRERKGFERNGLVAVFLRVLEYYTGILFLTTNRLGDFDEAFASRIHMSLHYPELDERKTKKVFQLNLDLIQERFNRQGRKVTYDASSIENFAEDHFRRHRYSRWNGRQIRNACQTALALAEFDAHGGKIEGEVDKKVEVALQLKYFQLVQRAYLDFGRYLGDIRGTQGDRRAIDYGLRAKTDTPYQTTPSLFSASAATGMMDSGHSSSLSGEHNNNNNQYPQCPPEGGQGGDPFQPLVNQGGGGGGYRGGRGPNMGHMYGQYGPQQGQLRPGGGYERYESPQGHRYSHPGSQQGQMGLGGGYERYESPQSHGSSHPGSQQEQNFQRQNLQGQNPQGQHFQGQYHQGQYLQGQPQYGYGNVQHDGGVQNHMIYYDRMTMTPFGTILLPVACAALMLSCVSSAAAPPSDPLLPARDVQKPMISGNVGDDVDCETVEKYTTEPNLPRQWFLRNVLPPYASTTPFRSRTLFYSANMSRPARNKARREGLTTIWDVWPCPLYDHRPSPQNPLRCIHRSPDQRRTFFENMSRAFALRATERATVLHDARNYYAPPSDGIWASVERKHLVRVGGAVNWLRKVAEGVAGVGGRGVLECVEWERWPGAAPPSEAPCPEKLRSKLAGRDVEDGGGGGGGNDHDGGEMERRAVIDFDDGDNGFGYCMPESEYEFFDENVDW